MKEIPLTQGKVALVDDEDYDFLTRWKWQARPTSRGKRHYAGRANWLDGKMKITLMHREILRPLPGFEVDHIDGNPLNNQRSNLRAVTRRENCWNIGRRRINTSGFIGVTFHKPSRKWVAQIRIGGRMKNLGGFEDAVAAAHAYDAVAREHRGALARTNFAEGGDAVR